MISSQVYRRQAAEIIPIKIVVNVANCRSVVVYLHSYYLSLVVVVVVVHLNRCGRKIIVAVLSG